MRFPLNTKTLLKRQKKYANETVIRIPFRGSGYSRQLKDFVYFNLPASPPFPIAVNLRILK